MSRKIAFPFLVLPDEAISSVRILMGVHGQPLEEAPHIFEHWDYARDIDVKVYVDVDCEIAAKALGISIDSLDLLAVLKIGTASGSVPRRIDVHDKFTLSRHKHNATLSAELKSHQLSGRLYIECSVLLGNVTPDCLAVSPQKSGARLWRVQHDVLIEDGGASRFPLETIDFAKSFSGHQQEHSPWYFDWRPGNWHMDFAANTRLYINSAFSEVVERIADSDRLTLTVILNDVINQIMSSFILEEYRDETLADCPEGSIGHQIKGWRDIAFPQMSWEAIAALKERRPGQYNAAIISAAQVGD
jgi:hypothetical protein